MKFVLSILFLSCLTASAANVYIRDGGSGSGTSWSDAFDDIPTSLTRGNTYYIADGSYASLTLDDAVSGTTRITIKKATDSDHGTETGWSSAYGDGKATFGSVWVKTGYHTIDGQNGGGPSDWECANCGFEFVGESIVGTLCCTQVETATSVIIAHTDLDCGSVGPESTRTLTLFDVNTLTIQYSYIHDSGCDLISANRLDNLIIEYSKLARNRQAEPGCHGDLLEYQIGDAANFTFRYNFFEDIVGSYAFGSHDPTITGYYIYGNIFYWTINPFFGNSMVGCLNDGGTLSNLRFFNNSLNGDFSGSNIGFGTLRGTGNEARNNIYRQSTGSGFSFGWSDTTHTANTFYNGSGGAEENLTGNPFTSVPTDFELTADATVGTDVSSLVTVDMNGDAYDADGDWDRGALAFGSGGDTTPPTLSSSTIASGGTTITLAFSETVVIGSGGNGGWTISMSGGSATLTYSSGSGFSSLVYSISRTIYSGETGTVSYTQPGDGIEDSSGNDLATLSGDSVTNGSSQTQVSQNTPRLHTGIKGIKLRP